MSESRCALVRWQFELTWSLLDLHADQLVTEDFLWEPAAHCWTMHRRADGSWEPDFAAVEPDPVPATTIAWITWHIGYWWTVALDHLVGRRPRDPAEIVWPGPGEASVAWLRGLRDEWLDALDQLTDADLDATASFPWKDDPERTVAHMLAWANAELMKNTAEIGNIRLLRRARQAG